MFFSNQKNIIQMINHRFSVHIYRILTLVMIIGFCSAYAHADSSAGAEVTTQRPSFKYQEIKQLAKKLSNDNTPEELEKLVKKSSDFVAAFPEYRRIDQIYYYLGNALVRLDRTKEGIKVFEVLIEKHPDARWVAASLYELGLAYDKLNNHDKADEVYKKLIEHPKFGSQSYATKAKMVLEQDRASRTGEIAKPKATTSAKPSEWVGKPAPNFEGTNLKGEKFSLEKYRGQVVLLDFWATWCGPCIKELPNVKRTYQKYKDQNFQIIGISLDRSKKPLQTFVEKQELAWVHYWDEGSKVSNQYKVTGIPSMFLVDGEGVIQNANLRGPALETAVAKLVKENLEKPADPSTKKLDSTSPQKSIPATKLIKPKTDSQQGLLPHVLRANLQEWIGKPAPDFQVKDVNGKKVSLKDYRGQVVLLDFWATWCGPCIKEMPKIKKTYAQYKDQNFRIIGISLDKSKESLETYIKKEKLTWVQYWDESREISTQFGVGIIPTTFLIDGSGIIQNASLGGFDVETAVAELVKENLTKPTDTPLPEGKVSDSPAEGQSIDPKAKEIIEAAVAAHGGLKKINSVKNIVVEAHSIEHHPDNTIDDEGTGKIYLFPDKYRSERHENNQTFITIFDGKSVYHIDDGELEQLPPDEAESYAKEYMDSDFLNLILPLTGLLIKDVNIQYGGIGEVKDVSASVLIVTPPSGKKLKFYISKKTNYLVKLTYTTKFGKKDQDVVKYFNDYRDVSGIKIPHHRTTITFEHRETFITDVKLNVEVDEALFRPEVENK